MRCGSTALQSCHPLHQIRQDFESQMGRHQRGATTALSVTQSESEIVIDVDLPGVRDEDVTVTVNDGHLVVAGDRPVQDREDARLVYNTRRFGEFRRVLKLDESLDADSADAVLKNGVLSITLKRRPETQPQTVTIRHAD